MLHLHVKTCSAGEEVSCPTGYNGCEQSRKLLAHYRRCRSIRAKQATQLAGRRDSSAHHCLVCSLVARQARSMLDLKPSSKSTSQRKNSSRQTISSFMLDSNNELVAPPKLKMPPPPPRLRFLPHKVGDVRAASLQANNSISSADTNKYSIKTTSCAANLAPLLSGEDTGSSALDHSMQTFPQDFDVQKQVRSRERSASHPEAADFAYTEVVRRSRSASVGDSSTAPVLAMAARGECETIEEEGSDSSRGSADHINFDTNTFL